MQLSTSLLCSVDNCAAVVNKLFVPSGIHVFLFHSINQFFTNFHQNYSQVIFTLSGCRINTPECIMPSIAFHNLSICCRYKLLCQLRILVKLCSDDFLHDGNLNLFQIRTERTTLSTKYFSSHR